MACNLGLVHCFPLIVLNYNKFGEMCGFEVMMRNQRIPMQNTECAAHRGTNGAGGETFAAFICVQMCFSICSIYIYKYMCNIIISNIT